MRNSETLINEMQLSALPFCQKKVPLWAKFRAESQVPARLMGQLHPIRPIRGWANEISNMFFCFLF